MDPTGKLIARKMFRLRIYEAKASAYQTLFNKVMQHRYPDFVPVKPYGNIGDRKNDGYIPANGRFFQVHAPENPTEARAATTAASKAANDFAGMLKYWNKDTPVKEFRFVFNDEYRGAPPPLLRALAKIQTGHGISASVFLAKDLEEEALSLEPDRLMDVIDTPIPPIGILPSVDFGVLSEVIHHILNQKKPLLIEGVLSAPDFTVKIRFNGLSPGIASLLTVGSYQTEAITDFFSLNTNFARQQVRDYLSVMYSDSRSRLSKLVSAATDLGDLVFFDILRKIVPVGPKGDRRNTATLQDAAIVVMAYYFEACDIFESPDATT